MPTPSDAFQRALIAAREARLRELTNELDALAKDWSAARLAHNDSEAARIGAEMARLQEEVARLEMKR